MNIRFAQLSDAFQIATVHVNSWQSAYRGILPDLLLDSLSIEEKESDWRRILHQNPGSALVLESCGQIIGWSAFGPARDKDLDPAQTQELLGIYLLPFACHHGHGTQLYTATEHEILKHSPSAITLWVLEQNTPARTFYEKLGFTTDLTEPRPIGCENLERPKIRYRKTL